MSTVDPAIHEEISRLVEGIKNEAPANNYWSLQLKDTPSGRHLLKLSGEYHRYLAFHLISQIGKQQGYHNTVVTNAFIDLVRRKIPFTHDEVARLVKWLAINDYMRRRVLNSVISQLEHYLENEAMTAELHESIRRLIHETKSGSYATHMRQQVRTLEKLVTNEPELPIVAGEAWSDQAIADLSALSEAEQRQWIQFLTHLQETTGSAPSARWQKQARTFLTSIGYETFRQFILGWVQLIDKPRTATIHLTSRHWGPNPNDMIVDGNADILRGLAWVCSGREDAEVARALTTLALSAYRKVPQVGPRCVRVGNACVWALGNMPGMSGVYQLALLQVKVKFGTAQKGIEKALTAAAEREGLPRDEIEELAMPTYGLTEVGLRQDPFGDFTAELRVTGTHDVELTWIKPDGKEQRAVPKQVKADFGEELKELQQAAKDIVKMLPAQRDRIDNLYLRRKSWEYPSWCERYLDHPLLGVVARRLIWQFTAGDSTTTAIWHDDHFVNAAGETLPEFVPVAQVTLWHPIDATTDEIVAWRAWLEQHQIQQPFKQAHREIYILTDAERQTRTYSNRFASHILRQHQFNALCSVRDWRNKLRLMVDDTYPPATKELPEWGLRAEYWIEGAGDNYPTDLTDAGTYLRIATDQVRFHLIDADQHHAHAYGGGYGATRYSRTLHGIYTPNEALPLGEIPPLVFSEIMRDIDLFVGVASVGNDPTWSDGGPNGRYQGYWERYSFGDLTETAQTRKAVLERLVPYLKIAGRCELRDRFLVVRGKWRTYKIHLGSSNILMEPNDQYLCIVPGRGGNYENENTSLFLPFEGDRTLALILSKAFLLAEDSSIKDQSIVQQIRR